MDLSNIGIVLFFSILSFVIGVLCAFIPFISLKKKLARLINTSDPSADFSIASEQMDIVARLRGYMKNIESRIKDQSNHLFFLQQKADTMASMTKEAIILLDEKGQLLFHNPQSREIFYLDEKKTAYYLHEITRSPDVMNIFKQCLKKQDVITRECVFSKKNQYIKSSFQVTAMPIGNKELKIKNVILLFYDQTDIKETQQAHIDFVSNVSHELKTPLTAIQGYVEMLIHDLSQKKFDQFENFLQILFRNCKRMGNLVNDLLSLSNLVSQAHLNKKKLSTKDVTNRVVKQIKSIDHKLHFFFSAPYVMAHPTWVEIVLFNLIDNACRHTPEKSDVYVRWEKMSDRVVLKVIDNGEGISEKYRQRIFERFFRIDPARSRGRGGTGGTGVGLALVKQSMEKHGGFVRVVPASLGGTEFICEFPNA